MDETKNRNSMKLDIEAVRLSENEREYPKETYKQLSEFDLNDKTIIGTPIKNSNMVREKVDKAEDGADESMLGGDEKAQLARKDEVKFISGEHPNGDAKIDIGSIDKGFTGMTKEELMKYANDPFWVRLRWIFFILFWFLWIAMLAGAILIILKAPKCSAPTPLSWFKQGPLVQLPATSGIEPTLIEKLKSINAKGVIYELPADKTYSIESPEVQTYVKNLVAKFQNTSINVILDLTPNYVTTENELYKLALTDEIYRSAFVWAQRARQPTNWISKTGDGSAWKEVKPQNFVLSQFGVNNIDLQLNDPIAKEKFKEVLRSLIKLGVKGFRLANAKHYIINKDYMDDSANKKSLKVHTDYDFWTHSYTTYQQEIGPLLHEFWKVVNNETNGEGFLSVTEIIEEPEAFTVNGTLGFDLPIYSLLPHTLLGANRDKNVTKQLINELTQNISSLALNQWVQWPYDKRILREANIGVSEYNMFLFLLPGVPVGTLEEFTGLNGTNVKEIEKLESIRASSSYQHGSFDVYTDAEETIIAYTRIKSGNPGYFVAFNPNDSLVTANFSSVASLPDELNVHMVSKSHTEKEIGEKVSSSAIPISARSVIILSYVPKPQP